MSCRDDWKRKGEAAVIFGGDFGRRQRGSEGVDSEGAAVADHCHWRRRPLF